MKRREETEINIRADGMIRAAEHVLKGDREKRMKAFGEQIEDGIFCLKEALFEGDPHTIKDLTTQLRKLLKEAK